MKIAGEITEFEESFLQQLILEKDPSVRETLRRYSLYKQFTIFFYLVATASPSSSFYMQRMVTPICSQRKMKNMQPIFLNMSPKSHSSSVRPSSNCTLRFMTKMDRLLCPHSPPRMHCMSFA